MKILVDTHSHTVASTHAYSTVHDYIQHAAIKGMQLFSLTDHGPEMPDSPHPWHFGNRKIIPRLVNNVGILRAIEANITPPDGELDIPEGMLPFLDFAIASFHEPVYPPSDRKTHTRAMINAIQSGKCQIIGHPGNPSYPIDVDDVIRAARDYNVVLEINNSSFIQSREGSTPHCVHLMERIDALDWKVSFGSDAHIAFSLGDFSAAIGHAERLNFPIGRIVNRDAHSFLAFLAEHGKPVALELEDWLKTIPKD
ncbi:phosphatase [Salinispirillum marinum]|uniref:Phosphatase n=2 Tax=Saccharospirillaceae TaxID=255527 RepID=A0ABV8BGK3_9GAMM